MELKPKNKGSGDAHVDPLPCVSTVKTPGLPRRAALTERSWPFLGSVVLHAVMFEILFFPALQTPNVLISQAPTVLWFTPFIVPGDSGHLAEMMSQPAAAFVQQANAAEAVLDDSLEDEIVSDPPATQPAYIPATATEAANTPKAESMFIQTPPKALSKVDRHLHEPKPVPRQAIPLPAPPVSQKPESPSLEPPREKQPILPAEQPGNVFVEKEQANRERLERKAEVERLSRELVAQKLVQEEKAHQEQRALEQAQQSLREQSERERVAAEKIRQEQEVRDRVQQERSIQEEQERLTAERARQVQRVREQEQQALREQARRKQVAAEKARQERAAQEHLQRERKLQAELALRKKPEQPLEQPQRSQLAAIVKQQKQPPAKVPEDHTKKPSAQQPQKGLVLPLVKGDLKLVITGSTQPNMNITFKEFAPSRRNKPFNRAEARRVTTIIPLVATTQENSRELIIEKTNPGIYTITVAPLGDKADVDFSLKLFEGSSRAIIRELGRHTLTGKKVLVKILMPEGVLWDDEKAFTGSMEDSDSITKFNAATGLVWKEYGN